MDIFIESRKRKIENIIKDYPKAIIIDVTSNSDSEYRQLSPFYPVGDIPVPGFSNLKAVCVEAIWQALKVFELFNYDLSYLEKSHKNIKRTVRKYGKVKGHFYNGELLSYIDARKKIYLPAYKFVLEEKLKFLINKLQKLSKTKTLVLLDYTKNDNILDTKKPLSHAAIIRAAIIKDYSILENGYKPTKINNQPIQKTLF